MARLLVGAFGLATLLAWWNPDLKKIVTIAWAYVLGNVLSVGYAVIEWATTSRWSACGTRRASQHLRALLACSLSRSSRSSSRGLPRSSRGSRWPRAGVRVGVWISGSRGAFAALIASRSCIPCSQRSVPAALGLLAVFAPFLAFFDRLLGESSSGNALGRLLGRGSASGSDQAREQLAEAAISQFQAHPILGVGLADVLAAHIIYLQITAALGVIGLAFFLLVVWTRQAVRGAHSAVQPARTSGTRLRDRGSGHTRPVGPLHLGDSGAVAPRATPRR